MKRVLLLVALCCLLVACDGADQNLISSSVTLGGQPLVLVPERPLRTPFHFNLLCIEIPPDYHIDFHSLVLRNENGTEVRIAATLVDTDGAAHPFNHQGFLAGRYVTLMSDPGEKPGVRFKEVSISSTPPLQTKEIRWISTDEL